MKSSDKYRELAWARFARKCGAAEAQLMGALDKVGAYPPDDVPVADRGAYDSEPQDPDSYFDDIEEIAEEELDLLEEEVRLAEQEELDAELDAAFASGPDGGFPDYGDEDENYDTW